MAYWCAARLQPRREALALHCLGLAGYAVYLPRLREQRISHGRRIEVRPPLFPGYCFVLIELQWHAARWAPGTLGLIMDGVQPARIPDAIIAEIRSRERGDLVVLPSRLERGAPVRILRGPFREQLALFAGQTPHERVAVLLALFGGQRRIELPAGDVEALTN